MSYLELIDLLDNNKYTKKCRDNILKSISMKDPEDFKFMDIETKGLSNVPIILIGVAEIKNDKIRLIHPIDNKFSSFANNSKIIFRGHSHESKVKTAGGPNVFCAYVPTSCDMFYQEGYGYPGIYDVLISFNNKGVINELIINSLIYIDKFVKVAKKGSDFLDAYF